MRAMRTFRMETYKGLGVLTGLGIAAVIAALAVLLFTPVGLAVLLGIGRR